MIQREEAQRWLEEALELPAGASPFPWQRRMLDQLLETGEAPRTVDLPTGVGKTSTMAIWLVARAAGANVPRRLVYVVDRRAVVDQATDVALQLRAWVDRRGDVKASLGLSPDQSLPISTLRGQLADNREWLEDPSAPAIIVGTVDMVGSRLLFEGYGVSRKMRPYHAGLLGIDSLIVLDEAHLVPPFDALLGWVADADEARGRSPVCREVLPPTQYMRLSATMGAASGTVFRLDAEDQRHEEVHRRLEAPKALALLQPALVQAGDKASKRRLETARAEALIARLVEEAAALARNEHGEAQRVLVYCDRRRDAQAVYSQLCERFTVERLEDAPPGKARKRKKPRSKKILEAELELFVGARRVRERQTAARRLAELGFLASQPGTRPTQPTFLVATSAAEVGVDLDADHMVCDLVAWERMVQRLGRVNRRGRGEAQVRVVLPPTLAPRVLKKLSKNDREAERALEDVIERLATPIRTLPLIEDDGPDASPIWDASPKALIALVEEASRDEDLYLTLERAYTEVPLRPPLSRPLLDAWSMTSLKEHPGRPHPAPWLRGWVDEAPQVAVAWRSALPCDSDGRALDSRQIEAFFEAAPMHLTERLETAAAYVCEVLGKRAEKLSNKIAKEHADPTANEPGPFPKLNSCNALAAVVIDASGKVHSYSLREVAEWKSGQGKQAALHKLNGSQLFVHAALGGLENGLLDDKSEGPVPAADDPLAEWLISAEETVGGRASDEPVIPWRIRLVDADALPTKPPWYERLRLPHQETEEGEVVRWWLIEKWRHDAATEEDRSSAHPQLLEEHLDWTADDAARIAERLNLGEPWRTVLTTAARLHDLGKRAARWQRAFHAPNDGNVYAKTLGPVEPGLLEGYRHELGSLLEPESREALQRLAEKDEDAAELATHLVLAHHGYSRPLLPWTGCDQAPPSLARRLAREAAERFVTLQRAWGPWGLAWWEALLRAADQQASRRNDARATSSSAHQIPVEASGGAR